ncbi:TPA: hypothetical protein NV714_000222 [Escherichia coli]|nr:hypothetical protein [Escherichia coli]
MNQILDMYWNRLIPVDIFLVAKNRGFIINEKDFFSNDKDNLEACLML